MHSEWGVTDADDTVDGDHIRKIIHCGMMGWMN